MSLTQGAKIPNHHFAVVPSDTVDFTQAAISIFVGVAGDVTAVMGGDAVKYIAIAGQTITGNFSRVDATGTDATDMVGQSVILET